MELRLETQACTPSSRPIPPVRAHRTYKQLVLAYLHHTGDRTVSSTASLAKGNAYTGGEPKRR